MIFLVIILWSLLACSNSQDFRTNIEGPILLNTTSYVYFCNLLDSLNGPTLYDVVFLFDFVADANIPVYTNAKSNDRVPLQQVYLADKMNKQIRCRADNALANVHAVSANYINIGIQTSFIKSVRDLPSTCDSCVTEGDKDPLDIRYTATVPFRCPDTNLYTKCTISANITTTANVIVKGVATDSPCIISFTQTDADNLYRSNLSIYAVKDSFTSPVDRPNYVLLNFPSFPSYTIGGKTYQDNWNNYQMQTDIRHIDKPRGTCTISGVSQVTTFDGYTYQNQAVGQFSYVRSISGTPFEVQLRHWPCTLDSDESCVCGVAVQEASVDVVVDMCIDGVAHIINHKCLLFPTDSGVKVVTNKQKNRFAIIFPSGNSVYGSIVGRELSLDIYVNSDMKFLQQGLCGTFDQDQANDILQVNNVEQWRLPINSSIFDGVLKSMPADATILTSYSGESYCSCKNGVATCAPNLNNVDLINQFTWGMTENVQPLVPGDFGSCQFRMDASYYSRRYMYYMWKTNSYAFSWPTMTGISEAQAIQYCRTVLWSSSPISSVCTALTQSDLDGIINKCKTEIQIYGYYESAFNIEPELGRLCISKGAATASASGQGMTGLGNLRNLSLAYCDSFTCNFNGNCTGGSCVCLPGISSIALNDCAFFKSANVLLSSIYKGSLCDVRTQDCTKFLYYTQNIDAVFPTCRFNPTTVYFGGTNLGLKTVLGNVVDENDTICYVPKEFLDIITYPTDSRISATYRGGPTLFNVSVGNEAAGLSSNLRLLIYDSYCYNCTNSPDFTCVAKQIDNSTCFINGYCIRNNTVKSGDPTLYCNVDLNKNNWSAVPPPAPIVTTTMGTLTGQSTSLSRTAVKLTVTDTTSLGTSKILLIASTTSATTSLGTTTSSIQNLVLEKYLTKISNIPKYNISSSKVQQLTNAVIANTIPKISGCSSSYPNNPTADIFPDPLKTLADNMNQFLQTYCINTSPQDADFLADALALLSQQLEITTSAPTSGNGLTFPQGSRTDIQADLSDFVGNYLMVPLTTSQVQSLDLVLAQNPNCVNANSRAKLINPPLWNNSLTSEQNFQNFLAIYCDSADTASLASTSKSMASVISLFSITTSLASTITTYKPLDGATIAAIVTGVIGSIAFLSLLIMCCCCWPNIYNCCRSICVCCPWLGYPQAVVCQVKECIPPPMVVTTCSPAPAQVPSCTPMTDCESAWRPIRSSVYVRSSPGCVDPCSKPVSRTLVPYKDRYCGSAVVGCQMSSACDCPSRCKRCL